MKEVLGIDGPCTASTVGFRLAPVINAAGRLADAQLGVDLLTTDSEELASQLAKRLQALNLERRHIEQEVVREAQDGIGPYFADSAVVVGSQGWHAGVVGIVAARLVERYHRPAVVVAFNAEGLGRPCTLEDTLATEAELEKEFGPDVLRLVKGVTKIGQIPFKSYEEKQAENFRKMVLSMADDIRVVFIKLADRLHNMRTLAHMSESKQSQIAQETLEIYAPLANRLGMSWIKQELEDLCFQYVNPDAYRMLKLRVAKRDEERQDYLQALVSAAQEALESEGLSGSVQGRPKHLYGIYQKMERSLAAIFACP